VLIRMETVHIGARIETDLVERLSLLAAQRERTFSAELRLAIRRHLVAAESSQQAAEDDDGA
jgi:hypothetical protein